ncbi:MAG: WD40 repeat domain-containing protein [Okeania sp. SIO3B5]|uniref:WD40 repeat domain-containing protein n=1 Tax=Okeania sp. SIO3B5 TaxID=2607811 RepID=UPI0013FE8E21|nr:WD40 repeat domain-containing protein [Okeania sp. SIO3B5]NEO51758.1 WD40 repeat domain-containing protein [Okeania sp. SIO3B5]
MNMKNYNIITLGPSGSGKTVFLASFFRQLSTPTSERFFLEVPNHPQRIKLNEIYSKIDDPNKDWPGTTIYVTETIFTCCVTNLALEKFPVCQFTYTDYPGSILTDILEGEYDILDFQQEVSKANAVLVMIDGLKLLKLTQGKDLDNEAVRQLLLRDLPNMMQLVNLCKRDTPVHFIISKWDLLKDNYKLSEITEFLLEKVDDFKNVVHSRIKAGSPVRLIPVSSIGMDFATLQDDGSMKKKPGAIPKPFQLEIPIAYVLIDGVKTDIKASKASSEKIPVWDLFKNSFPSLDYLIHQFVLNELAHPDKEKYLQEVRDWETALKHLVIIFLKHLKDFEERFPEANLGGEVLFAPEPIHNLTKHEKVVCSVGFTSDGKTLFSSSDDRKVLFWDVARGNLQKKIVQEKSGWVLANLSQDDKLLFTASADKSIKVWDANTGKLLYKPLKEHSEPIDGFVVSPDGSTLISGSRDRTVKVWQLKTNHARVIHSLSEHQGYVYALAVSPNGQTLATAGTDKKMLIWELPIKNDKFLKFLALKHPSFIKALAFSSDGKMLVSGCGDKTIYVWDTKTWNLRYNLEGHTGAIWSLAISPDNHILASGSNDCTIKVWNLSTGTLKTALTGHTGIITTLAFSPDNQTLASGSDDKTIKIWQIV